MKTAITAAALLITATPALASPWVQLCTGGSGTTFALICRFGHDPLDYLQYKLVQTSCTQNSFPYWQVAHSLDPTWGTPVHAVGHTWSKPQITKGCATGYFTWTGFLRATLRQVIDSATGQLVPPYPQNILNYAYSASVVKGSTGGMCGVQK